jgi:hypothetical protein
LIFLKDTIIMYFMKYANTFETYSLKCRDKNSGREIWGIWA